MTEREQTYITFQLYLNDVKEQAGGATAFTNAPLTYGRHVDENKRNPRDLVANPITTVPVQPVAGRVLLFEHHLRHEGAIVLEGVKYALRSDIFYKLNGEKPNRSPRWSMKRVLSAL